LTLVEIRCKPENEAGPSRFGLLELFLPRSFSLERERGSKSS
jgi:hypothetical protein